MAGLQATAQPGERRLCSFYVSGGRLLAWFDCVGDSCGFFIWAKMYGVLCFVLVFFPRPGPRFYYGDDRFHPSVSCTQPPGDLPVDFLLPGRTLCP